MARRRGVKKITIVFEDEETFVFGGMRVDGFIRNEVDGETLTDPRVRRLRRDQFTAQHQNQLDQLVQSIVIPTINANPEE